METTILISKFWTRFWAFFIDTILLGIVGYIVGLLFENYFVNIGNYGLLYGLAIALFYFSIFNSKLLNGQTLGQRLLNIQVVDIDGNTITFKKSFIRASVLCAPYFLLELPIPGISDVSGLYLAKYLIMSLILFGIFIIYIFNKGNRQSIHDIAVGTYVAITDRQDEPSYLPKPTKSAFYIFGAASVLYLGISLFVLAKLKTDFSEITLVYKNLSKIDGVLGAGISKNISTVYSKETTTSQSYLIALQVTKLPENESEIKKMPLVREAVITVLKFEPTIVSFDVVSIALTRGFNLGIAKKHNTYRINTSPQELYEFIN